MESSTGVITAYIYRAQGLVFSGLTPCIQASHGLVTSSNNDMTALDYISSKLGIFFFNNVMPNTVFVTRLMNS